MALESGESSFHVLFVHGPAASGKYTIGSLLSPILDMPLFHNHLVVDAVQALFDFGTPEFIALRSTLWRDCFAAAAAARQSLIFTFHPEASVAYAVLDEMLAPVYEACGEVHFVELQCDDKTVSERLSEPSRAAFGKLSDKHLYASLNAAGAFDFPSLPAPMISIDTARHAPIESAQLIVQAFRNRITSENPDA
jgi:hypothetical protein